MTLFLRALRLRYQHAAVPSTSKQQLALQHAQHTTHLSHICFRYDATVPRPRVLQAARFAGAVIAFISKRLPPAVPSAVDTAYPAAVQRRHEHIQAFKARWFRSGRVAYSPCYRHPYLLLPDTASSAPFYLVTTHCRTT